MNSVLGTHPDPSSLALTREKVIPSEAIRFFLRRRSLARRVAQSRDLSAAFFFSLTSVVSVSSASSASLRYLSLSSLFLSFFLSFFFLFFLSFFLPLTSVSSVFFPL
jgi:hypothetical protein